jgi:regulator of sigma E protease
MNLAIAPFSLFMTIFSALMIIGVLVFVHELGHFLFAKLFRVGVIEFAIGFGKKIFSKQIGDTVYSIRLFPAGGFVKMVGEDRRLLDESLTSEQLEEIDPGISKWDRSSWFLTKCYYQKILIVFAGPLFNFIFAALLTVMSATIYGVVTDILNEPVVGAVAKGQPADKAGIKPGDRIINVGGAPVKNWQELAEKILSYKGKELSLTIQREVANAIQELELRVRGEGADPEIAALTGESDSEFRIGIIAQTKRERVSLLESVEIGVSRTVYFSWITLKSLISMVNGALSPKNIRGPIFIFQKAGEVAQESFEQVLNLTFLLSISLAVFNLLPIPILDGGHLVIFTIEALIKGQLSMKAIGRASYIGVIILLSITVIAFSNDILDLVK